MRVCGKALPPRAALLLTFDFAGLVLVAPMLFLVPILAGGEARPLSAMLASTGRLMVAGLACQAIFYYNELYNLQVVRRPAKVLACVLRAFGLLFVLLAMACLTAPAIAPVLSRALMFALILGAITVLARLLALPRRQERVLLLGAPAETAELEQTILDCPEWNMRVEAVEQPAAFARRQPAGQPLDCDRLIVASPGAQEPQLLEAMLGWKLRGTRIEHAQHFFERATGRVCVDRLTAGQLVFSENFQNGAAKRRAKRVFDLAIALGLLLLTSPVILLVALLLAAQRDGPVVFRQQRVGLNGIPFSILKFRTMRPARNGAGPQWAAQEQHRITPLGGFLRKYRLDELLQCVNVVRGEMSLVGPRPEQPAFCELLAAHVPFYPQRHTVLPGLTGWAQVRYHYGASVEESKRKLEFDLFYVKHLSLWLDCAILIETVKVVLVGRGAR